MSESVQERQNDTQQLEAETTDATPETDETDMLLKVEAVLMTTDRPQSSSRLADVLGEGLGTKLIHQAIEQLNRGYAESGRSFRIERVAGGWQIRTLPAFATLLSAFHRDKAATRLSPAAMETLALIAYKQPTLRAEIEAIRGVASGEVIRSLMERRLVKIVGRAEELGRPMLYGTTKAFLEVFGLANLKDLPKVEEFSSSA